MMNNFYRRGWIILAAGKNTSLKELHGELTKLKVYKLSKYQRAQRFIFGQEVLIYISIHQNSLAVKVNVEEL